MDEIFPEPARSKLLSETIEAEAAFREVRRPVRYKTRSRVDRKAILSHHHTRPLDSLKNVLGELGRVYRSVINGSLSTIEGVRLSFILREVRGALEAVNAEEAKLEAAEAARAAAAATVSSSAGIRTVNIVSVPQGCYFSSEQLREMERGESTIDLLPQPEQPEQPEEPIVQPEPEFVPQSPQEARLFAELSSLSRDELLQRAKQEGLVDVDED